MEAVEHCKRMCNAVAGPTVFCACGHRGTLSWWVAVTDARAAIVSFNRQLLLLQRAAASPSSPNPITPGLLTPAPLPFSRRQQASVSMCY
jgi:hypothetical protein